MVCALDSGASGQGLNPGRGHCVVLLGKTLYSHSASLHPGVYNGTGELIVGGNPVMGYSSQWSKNTPSPFMLLKLG